MQSCSLRLLSLTAAIAGCAAPLADSTPASTAESDGCRREVGELRGRQADRAMGKRFERSEALFAEGQPLPALEPVLSPLVAAHLALTYPRVLRQTLECRTWVCKLTFTGHEPGHMNLGFTDFLGERIHGAEVVTYRKDIDAGTGLPVRIATMMLMLRHPNGEPRTREQLLAEAAAPFPTDAAVCQSELARLRAVDEQARAGERRREEAQEPQVAYEVGTPNPKLAAETAPRLLAVFGLPPQPTDQVVTCRGQLCKVLLPVTNDRRALLFGRRAMGDGYRAYEPMVNHQPVLFLWAMDPAYTNTRRLFREVIRDVEAARPRCQQLAPTRGGLTATMKVPTTTAVNPPAQVAVTFDGTLAGTPLGRCVADQILAAVKSASRNGPFARSELSYDFLFPRQK
jgi:hypothetical protein